MRTLAPLHTHTHARAHTHTHTVMLVTCKLRLFNKIPISQHWQPMTSRARFTRSGFVKSSGLDSGPVWEISRSLLSAAAKKPNHPQTLGRRLPYSHFGLFLCCFFGLALVCSFTIQRQLGPHHKRGIAGVSPLQQFPKTYRCVPSDMIIGFSSGSWATRRRVQVHSLTVFTVWILKHKSLLKNLLD